MMSPRVSTSLLLLLVLIPLHPVHAGGSDPARPVQHPHIPRVRTADARVRAVIEEGLRKSSTFRALVGRLGQSDVVVYVHCDIPSASLRPGGGRLTFVSAAGGFRYVVVSLAWQPSRRFEIAMLAHELQHAVEIAETPAIVDSASLAQEYRRMADAHEVTAAGRLAFDTDAANAAGKAVLREITRSDRSDRSD